MIIAQRTYMYDQGTESPMNRIVNLCVLVESPEPADKSLVDQATDLRWTLRWLKEDEQTRTAGLTILLGDWSNPLYQIALLELRPYTNALAVSYRENMDNTWPWEAQAPVVIKSSDPDYPVALEIRWYELAAWDQTRFYLPERDLDRICRLWNANGWTMSQNRADYPKDITF